MYDRIWYLMFYHVMYADYTEASGMYMLNVETMDWPTVLHTVVLF